MFCHVIWKVSAEESFDDMRYCHHCVKQRHLCYYCRVNDACTVNYLTNTTEDLRLNIKRINCVDRTQDFCQKIAKTLPKHCQNIAKVEKHHVNPCGCKSQFAHLLVFIQPIQALQENRRDGAQALFVALGRHGKG